ncbi:MAG: peptide chain release factor N(5)-glutamine methyltransferase [Psychroserpens sp.]|uniref:peptide chain release factor N(5)-glutamine methyltransferase n=1 Tax=Psychroserpens sp. TaxID=2020870 RepID=UPI003CA9D6A8
MKSEINIENLVLKEILYQFHEQLDELYGKEEVDSFFGLLMDHYLKLKRIHLVLHPKYEIEAENGQLFLDALSQLKSYVPIQYIIGETEFYGLRLKVNPNTLIPRPETEELVDWIVTCHLDQDKISQLKILDIGSGTGCIAISLAKHLSNANVSAVDVSEAALKTATQNAELNQVEVNFLDCSILHKTAWAAQFSNQKFDVIVSNPPYVRHLEKSEIQPNVLDNEPHLALFVDDVNPLQFYKAICEFAQHYLKIGGMLYVEINAYLGAEMLALFQEFGFNDPVLRKDLFGKNRMICARH